MPIRVRSSPEIAGSASMPGIGAIADAILPTSIGGLIAVGDALRSSASHRQTSLIKSGPRTIVTAHSRIRDRMPIVLPLSAIGRSHLGNPG